MALRPRNPAARRRAIQRELTVRGVVSVEELCRLLDSSPATVRRDLDALEEEGVLKRTYGGAALPRERPAEQAFAVREQQDVAAKLAIAAAAMRLILPGMTLFLNDGTTVMSLAREIVASKLEVFVATPAFNVAAKLAESPAVTVCLLGGFVRQTSLATSGPFAEAMAGQINADLALLSPDGFSPEKGLAFAHAHDASLARRMVEQAQRTVALVAGAKFARSGRIVGAATDAIDAVITDAIDGEQAEKLRRLGVEVIDAARPPAARLVHA